MNHSLLVLATTFLGFLLLFVASSADEISDGRCECAKRTCGCCTSLRVKHIVDGNGINTHSIMKNIVCIICANFSYIPEELGISVTITYNDKTILNNTVSAHNPPPLCVVHVDQLHMNICLRFYDLAVKDRRLSGCSSLEVSFSKFIPNQKIKLGCFKLDTLQRSSTEIQSAFNEPAVDYLNRQSKHNEVEPKVESI
ncbi:hypothetical protein TSAR_014731 [Trichomalopsis sarcophagae]|uniref:DUF4773 domain-containing protein n=1 Tax=Trichomalopsis sarcophagae TaxID=543379 RepID=A0A232EXD4_9HYME|nr:hypothetical protein TSAR_014731 [Trichomalopsis sarcophagae]